MEKVYKQGLKLSKLRTSELSCKQTVIDLNVVVYEVPAGTKKTRVKCGYMHEEKPKWETS